MPVTGPIHGPKKPILLYWFDDTKLPLDPNQWVPWSATAGPAITANNKIWDGAAWVNMVGSTDGRQYTDIDRVGHVTQTGDDWTQRLRSLNDESVLGLAQAIGLPALPTTDAGLDYTVRRWLELIYAALGGTVNQHYDVITFICVAAVGAPQVFSSVAESIGILCEGGDVDIEFSDAAGAFPGAPSYIPVKKNAFSGVPLNSASFRARNRGGAALPVATITVTAYFA